MQRSPSFKAESIPESTTGVNGSSRNIVSYVRHLQGLRLWENLLLYVETNHDGRHREIHPDVLRQLNLAWPGQLAHRQSSGLDVFTNYSGQTRNRKTDGREVR